MRSIVMICIWLAAVSSAMAADTKAEDIVAQHLDSIGTAEARAAVNSLAVQGTLRFKIIAGGAGESSGSWQRLSDGRKSKFVMKFGDNKWWGEQFVFDGNKASVAAPTSSHRWSAFGAFVAGQENIVKEGLLGGALSTTWALESINEHHIKLENLGRKKVDDRELDAVGYLSKNNGNMIVKLYFDPATHHHVMTVYTIEMAANIAHNDIQNARQQTIHYVLEERFSDFQTDNGITLPRQYDLRFSQQLQNGATTAYEWAMIADKVLENPNIAPVNFEEK